MSPAIPLARQPKIALNENGVGYFSVRVLTSLPVVISVVLVITRILQRTKCTSICCDGAYARCTWVPVCIVKWIRETTRQHEQRYAFNQFDFNIYCAMRRFSIRFGSLWSWHKNYPAQVNRINLSQTKCGKRKRHLLLKWSILMWVHWESTLYPCLPLASHPLSPSLTH